jgi:hypothetical protein
MHYYQYAYSNPVNNTDPSGRCVPADCLAIGRRILGGAARLKATEAFFAASDGPSFGFGLDHVLFTEWEFDSSRIDKSLWWNTSNAMLVGSMVEAQSRVAAGLGKQGWLHGLSNTWMEYIRAPSAERWWDAHNSALAVGVNEANKAGFFDVETPEEKLFIGGVLRRVDLLGQVCQRQGVCMPTNRGLLKDAIDAAGYPLHYPTVRGDRIIPVTILEYPTDLLVYGQVFPSLLPFYVCDLPFPYQFPGTEKP